MIAHAAYVLNTATHEEEKYARARAGLAKELERSTALGIGAICFHPGAAMDDNREAAAERVAGAIVHALEHVPNEHDARARREHGGRRTHVREDGRRGRLHSAPRAEAAARAHRVWSRHLSPACVGLRSPREATTRWLARLDEFEEATGEPPGFIHLNDSEGALGSNKDRHMLIGDGQIGVEPFRALLMDRRSRGIPLILETPQAERWRSRTMTRRRIRTTCR